VRLLPIAAVIVVALGIAWSVGPFLDYRAVERERKAMEAEVALLEQENLATEEQIDQLGRDAYLESLARKELNLARPGEDVYIVTVPETTTTESPSLDEGPGPGPLERALNSLLDLF
jgi:cell division protein FtsB